MIYHKKRLSYSRMPYHRKFTVHISDEGRQGPINAVFTNLSNTIECEHLKSSITMVKQASKIGSRASATKQEIPLTQRNKKEPTSARRRSGRQRIAPVEYWNCAFVRYDGTLIGVESFGALPSSEIDIAD